MQRYKSHAFIPFRIDDEYELIVEVNNEDDALESWLRWKNGMVTKYLIGLPIQPVHGESSPLTLDHFMYIAQAEMESYAIPPCLAGEMCYAAKWKDGVSPFPDGWKGWKDLLNECDEDDEEGEDEDDFDEYDLEIDHVSQQILGYECQGYLVIVAYDEETDRFRGWLSTPESTFQFLCFDAPREQDGRILTHNQVASLIEAEMDTNEHIQIVKDLLKEDEE